MAETPQHRQNMTDTIESLGVWFAEDSQVYVSGNMFIYYVPGDRLRHVSPDVFVVRGVPKLPERRRYLVWEEGKGPDLVIEFTSESTREEDMDDKLSLYRDTLRVQEYFLFDPFAEYLEPPLRGHRLRGGRYVPIRPVQGRLPSKVLGLHLERDGRQLRLYDPTTGRRLLTPAEEHEA
ncbi:MAG TPA: Uma2 family endonuclease, partial [Gemmataceae bacterium]|nr:Uma2 family endonuclease [Gemmataceae bacterium]